MASEALVVVLGDANLDQDLVTLADGLAGAGVPLLDGDGSLSAGAHHIEKGAVSEERGGGVCRCGSVADVATDGAGYTELGTARGVAGIAQGGHRLLDDGVGGDGVEDRGGADLHGAVIRQLYARELVAQLVDGHQVGSLAQLAIAELDQDVGSAGNDHGLGVFGERTCGVLDARGLVQGFDIVH